MIRESLSPHRWVRYPALFHASLDVLFPCEDTRLLRTHKERVVSMTITDIEERVAIMQLKQGDINGLEVLVRKYRTVALRHATRIMRDQDLAEESVQTAFLQVYDHIDQFDMSRPFRHWFLRIVMNNALKAYNRRAWQVPLADEGEEDTGCFFIDPSPSPEEQAVQAELSTEIAAIVDELPTQQRRALILRYYLDWSEADIAETLGCSTGAIKRYLYRARQYVADRLPHLQISSTKTNEVA